MTEHVLASKRISRPRVKQLQKKFEFLCRACLKGCGRWIFILSSVLQKILLGEPRAARTSCEGKVEASNENSTIHFVTAILSELILKKLPNKTLEWISVRAMILVNSLRCKHVFQPHETQCYLIEKSSRIPRRNIVRMIGATSVSYLGD